MKFRKPQPFSGEFLGKFPAAVEGVYLLETFKGKGGSFLGMLGMGMGDIITEVKVFNNGYQLEYISYPAAPLLLYIDSLEAAQKRGRIEFTFKSNYYHVYDKQNKESYTLDIAKYLQGSYVVDRRKSVYHKVFDLMSNSSKEYFDDSTSSVERCIILTKDDAIFINTPAYEDSEAWNTIAIYLEKNGNIKYNYTVLMDDDLPRLVRKVPSLSFTNHSEKIVFNPTEKEFFDMLHLPEYTEYNELIRLDEENKNASIGLLLLSPVPLLILFIVYRLRKRRRVNKKLKTDQREALAEVRSFIENGRIDKALNLLLELSAKNKEIFNAVELRKVKASYNAVRQKYNLGVLTFDEFRKEEVKIIDYLLNLAE